MAETTDGKKEGGVPDEGTVVNEGLARVVFRKHAFYNPVQVFNRDLSIHVISMFAEQRKKELLAKAVKKHQRRKKSKRYQEQCKQNGTAQEPEPSQSDIPGINILEALSATGLRSIRYVKEIPGVNSCIANDLSEDAVKEIRQNIADNGISSDKLKASHMDAVLLMHMHKTPDKTFDVIDLDPYGAPSIFLDSAVQAVSDGGLLCVTCTDMAVLCGNNPEACFSKYGSISLKAKYCHEMALRICLRAIASHANRYGRYIEPLLSVSSDFYIRVFVRVHSGRLQVKLAGTKLAYVYQAMSMDSFLLQPVAKTKERNLQHILPGTARVGKPSFDEFYNFGHQIGGPIWSAPIHDPAFVAQLVARLGGTPPKEAPRPGAPVGRRWKKLHGVLTAVNEECQECADIPLYYCLSALCNTLHCCVPKTIEFFSALRNAGYKVSASHANAHAVKTDAPNSVIWDILRCFVRKHPVSAKRLKGQPTSACAVILAKKPTLEADFKYNSKAKIKTTHATRFLPNPQKFWGPKRRAKKSAPKQKKRPREPTAEGSAVQAAPEKAAKRRPGNAGDAGTSAEAEAEEEEEHMQIITQELPASQDAM